MTMISNCHIPPKIYVILSFSLSLSLFPFCRYANEDTGGTLLCNLVFTLSLILGT